MLLNSNPTKSKQLLLDTNFPVFSRKNAKIWIQVYRRDVTIHRVLGIASCTHFLISAVATTGSISPARDWLALLSAP